jgi:hypothetical protein
VTGIRTGISAVSFVSSRQSERKFQFCKNSGSFRPGSTIRAFQVDLKDHPGFPNHKLRNVKRVRPSAPGVTLAHPSISTCQAAGRQCCQINKTFDIIIVARLQFC